MDSKKLLEIKQAIAVDSPNGYSVKNKDVHELVVAIEKLSKTRCDYCVENNCTWN